MTRTNQIRFDYRGDLFGAMNDSSLDKPHLPSFQRACLWLAVTLGYCRLTDTGLGDCDGVLPDNFAMAAARELSNQLRNLLAQLKGFVVSDKTNMESCEYSETVSGFLHARMDFWAARTAVDEAYMDDPQREPNANEAFLELCAQVSRDEEVLDAEMQEHLDILHNAGGTNLLSNLRSILHPAYSNVLPWWLDGRLEQVLVG